MSACETNPRVRFNPNGSATVDGEWVVRDSGSGWVAFSQSQGFLRDHINGELRARYDTRDEVLDRLLGPANAPA